MIKSLHARRTAAPYATAGAHPPRHADVDQGRPQRRPDQQGRALALSPCPPMYQLWALALRLEATARRGPLRERAQ